MTPNDHVTLAAFKKTFLDLVVDTHSKLDDNDWWFLRTFDKMMSAWNERLKELQ